MRRGGGGGGSDEREMLRFVAIFHLTLNIYLPPTLVTKSPPPRAPCHGGPSTRDDHTNNKINNKTLNQLIVGVAVVLAAVILQKCII